MNLIYVLEFKLQMNMIANTAWTAIINSVNQEGISDILIVIVVLAFGFLGLILGVFEFARR